MVKKDDGLKYIQVTLSIRDEDTLNRELGALKSINDNYPKYIITLDNDKATYEGIKEINALEFLLGNVDI